MSRSLFFYIRYVITLITHVCGRVHHRTCFVCGCEVSLQSDCPDSPLLDELLPCDQSGLHMNKGGLMDVGENLESSLFLLDESRWSEDATVRNRTFFGIFKHDNSNHCSL